MVQDVEQFLDRVHKHTRTKGQGYHVFREMEPCFRLLACSFPHIEASKRKHLDDHFRDSFRLRDKLKKSKKKKDQVSQIYDNHKNRKKINFEDRKIRDENSSQSLLFYGSLL